MKFSHLFFANHFFGRDHASLELTDLARKACLIHHDSSGVYSWLTLGLALERQVEGVIREEMDAIGFSETRLSLMQDSELWRESGRLEVYGAELMTLKNRAGRQFCLGATCEELATSIARSHYNKTDMNLGLYQFGNKYRDELRARGGMARAREFVMKDAYAFNSDEALARESYLAVRAAYERVFDRLGIDIHIKASGNGEIGGVSSEEFHAFSALGEDEIDGRSALECGHIFDLGDRYSRSMGLLTANGSFARMGCFGIGVSRLVMLLLERHRDERGFFGSKAFHTFDTVISVIDAKREGHLASGLALYGALRQAGVNALLDDRDEQAGKKLADAELIGARSRLIVSKRSIQSGAFELMDRQTLATETLTQEQLLNRLTRAG